MSLSIEEAAQLATIIVGIDYLKTEITEVKTSINNVELKLYGKPEEQGGGMIGEVRKNTTFRENLKGGVKIVLWILGLSGGGLGGFLGLSELVKYIGQ